MKFGLPIKLGVATGGVDFDSGCHVLLSPKAAAAFTQHNFCSFAKNMWFRHTGVRMPPHNLRRVYITDLLLRDTTIAVRESAANAMGHSTKTQEDVYNRASQRQSISLALTDAQSQVDERKRARNAKGGPGAHKVGNSSESSLPGAANAKIRKDVKRRRPTDTSVQPGEEFEYEVRDIRDVRAKKDTERVVEFKCVWERFPSEDYTWEPPKNFVTQQVQGMCMGYIEQAETNGTWQSRWLKPIFPPCQ